MILNEVPPGDSFRVRLEAELAIARDATAAMTVEGDEAHAEIIQLRGHRAVVRTALETFTTAVGPALGDAARITPSQAGKLQNLMWVLGILGFLWVLLSEGGRLTALRIMAARRLVLLPGPTLTRLELELHILIYTACVLMCSLGDCCGSCASGGWAPGHSILDWLEVGRVNGLCIQCNKSPGVGEGLGRRHRALCVQEIPVPPWLNDGSRICSLSRHA